MKLKYFSLILLTMVYLGLPFISASYPVNQEIDLKIPTTSDNCNLTISYPNTTILIYQETMQDNKGYANYTINPLESKGEYQYFSDCGSGTFQVNYQGLELQTSTAIIYSLGILLLIMLFYLTIMAYVNLPKHNPRDDYGQLLGVNHLKYLRIPLIGAAWFTFLAINFIVSGVARNFLFDSSITNIFFSLFTIQFKLTLPFIIVLLLYMLLEIFRDKELSGLLKRGLPAR